MFVHTIGLVRFSFQTKYILILLRQIVSLEKYWEPTGDFQYVRVSIDGKNEEISPFNSIPSAFWWFVVTATTVGYGGKQVINRRHYVSIVVKLFSFIMKVFFYPQNQKFAVSHVLHVPNII